MSTPLNSYLLHILQALLLQAPPPRLKDTFANRHCKTWPPHAPEAYDSLCSRMRTARLKGSGSGLQMLGVHVASMLICWPFIRYSAARFGARSSFATEN